MSALTDAMEEKDNLPHSREDIIKSRIALEGDRKKSLVRLGLWSAWDEAQLNKLESLKKN